MPGIDDLVYGNSAQKVMGVTEKMKLGQQAVFDLTAFKQARKEKNDSAASEALARLTANKEFLGYWYLGTPEETVPSVSTPFYSFHAMVVLGTLFPILFLAFLYFTIKGEIAEQRWLLPLGVLFFFLGHVAGQMGWILAEIGRQPWAIQGLLPVNVAATNLAVGHVQATFKLATSRIFPRPRFLMVLRKKVGDRGYCFYPCKFSIHRVAQRYLGTEASLLSFISNG